MQIDSTKNRTVLDKKATIALGNIARQRNEFSRLYIEQRKLIDSVSKESINYRNEADTLRLSLGALRFSFDREKEARKLDNEFFEVQKDYHKQEVKRLRRGKLTWGAIGVSIGAVLVLLFGG